MKSIQRRLTVWLLCGLALLCVAAGAGVYFAVRKSLLKTLDAQLAVDSRVVRFAVRGTSDNGDSESGDNKLTLPPWRGGGGAGGRLQDRMPNYDEDRGDAFFQVWNGDGTTQEKSISLGDGELPLPQQAPGKEPVFETERLADGRPVRTMIFRSAAGPKGRGGKLKGRRSSQSTITRLARDSTEAEATLSALLGGMVLVGTALGIGAAVLVRVSLRHGLKPLRELGRQTENIDADTLDARFDPGGAPLELKPVYAHLNDLINRLEVGFDRERRFSADLAHEMRTPVAELRMLSEVALKWPDQAGIDTHAATLEIADRLSTTIETLLSLARFESGEVSLQREDVDRERFIRDQWRRFAQRAAAENLQVEFRFDEGMAPMTTDPAMLAHIVGNLLSNAVEYTPAGGSILVAGIADGLEVSNTAPAMQQDDVAHLFDRYWRADCSRSDPNHSGLGLSLSRACADALGMRLSARYEPPCLTVRLCGGTGAD